LATRNIYAHSGRPLNIALRRYYTPRNLLLQGSHAPSTSTQLTSADWRLNASFTWCLDGVVGLTESADVYCHEPEMAAEVDNDFYCPRIDTERSRVIAAMNWMGQPLGKAMRIYPEDMVNISGVSWASGLPAVNVTGASATYVGASGDIPAFGRYTPNVPPSISNSGASKVARSVAVTNGQTYTIVVRMRCATGPRQVDMQFFGVAMPPRTVSTLTTSIGLQWITDEFIDYVYVYKAASTSINTVINFGMMAGAVDIAAIQIYVGNAGCLVREFENCTLICNPTPDDVTIDLPAGGTYQRLNDPDDLMYNSVAVNSGAPVTTSVTVSAMDGLWLGKKH
jgi:hypothetical protein